MQVYTRYRTAARRGRWRSLAHLGLASAGVAFLGWMFWHTAGTLDSRAPASATPKPAPAAGAQAPAAQAPAAHPPVPRTPAATNTTRITVSTNLVVRTNPNPLLVSAPAPPLDIEPVDDGPGLQSPASVLEAQLALVRLGVSPGALDGVLGSQTRAALRVYQRRERLPATGQLDPPTRARLGYAPPALTHRLVTPEDVAGLRSLSPTWLGKSRQDRLGYETVLELVSELSRAHPRFIRALNPGTDWGRAGVGSRVATPNAVRPSIETKADKVEISLGSRTLQVYDARGQLLAHFPCSIARRVEKRPVGTLRVVVIIRDPSYTFDPKVFPESAEGRRLGRKLLLPPGPNNPVGTAWIGLSRPGYGIHGTPHPEDVGRTESHGCFRLANWDAEHLADLVSVGTTVVVGR
ncbi:MAG TPA: L,D-transpeptidase family protein [Verrucomicrobiota bacterium]|nr:L,D-transpeptidase family protein [Verrucomicrobiota bacterium]